MSRMTSIGYLFDVEDRWRCKEEVVISHLIGYRIKWFKPLDKVKKGGGKALFGSCLLRLCFLSFRMKTVYQILTIQPFALPTSFKGVTSFQ